MDASQIISDLERFRREIERIEFSNCRVEITEQAIKTRQQLELLIEAVELIGI